MRIQEMRSSLEADYSKVAIAGDQLPVMPDWVTRRLYEKRNGLSLTPLPREVEVRTLRSIMATAHRNSAVTRPALSTDDADGEKEKLRLRIEALKLL